MFQYSLLLVFTVILFLYGFFPISNNTVKFSNDPPTQIGNITINLNRFYKPQFTKIVLFVIDALRWDFVTSDFMPLTLNHMKNKGCLSKVHVESPTVTLPRIKALTTGSIPQYIDVVRNLASSEILSDSWLHSAKRKGLKTVFYGDNTWEKLFPDFFTRSEGTTSFFVWDFTEVDNNVTRNVHLELQRMDWDIMILHYLGLDHIGHVLGPFSSRIPTKLKEMDEIINKIYKGTNESNTLILVTGDHGMRDSGGHGGTTQPEVTVPLVAIGLDCDNSSFLQTDIPANLAVLLGLNIPSTSIGQIQKEFLNKLSFEEYLFALRYNTELLLKKNNFCNANFDEATFFHETFLKDGNVKNAKIAIDLYQDCSEKITKKLYETSSKQDMSCLYIAVFVLLNILTMLLHEILGKSHSRNHFEIVSCSSIVFMQFFFSSDVIFLLFLLILTSMLIIRFKQILENLKISVSLGTLHIFLIITCFLHPVTFISTSFIEEEHYYWIYFTITLILLLLLELYSQEKSSINSSVIKIFLVLLFIRFSMDLNSTLENSVQNTDNWANILVTEENHFYHQIFFILSLVLVYFTLYNNNETSNSSILLKILYAFTLFLIFLLKSTTYHNAFLGKLIWTLIMLQKNVFKQYSWKHCWIQASTLLIKPHNVILIPIAVYTGDVICNKNNFKNVPALSIVSYMLSNSFYFLQGHRNSLASVDVSIGYTGLNDYYPLLVISQVLVHTYIFQVLFHLIVLQSLSSVKEHKLFWLIMLCLRTSVVMFTSIMMIVFKHHLFIWSVFSPKLFIESVHTVFLFIEICFWYGFYHFKQLVNKNIK